ncbi:MAG: proline--tRNA ligase [Candidatus Omnitrophica bacterium]|nr:proline--tRNA ligase [Candidatus Omnitrophota bacterium]
MKWSKALIPTLKETPAEAEAVSHKLMLRAGLIKKLIAGAYTYLPLGFKVLKNVENIVREEMDSAGAQELLMPAIQPPELWHKTGRYAQLGEDMIKYKDRSGREMVLGPTHEEVITDIAKSEIRSYRDMPKILYQIQTKFRDEARPRFGVVRSKEFIMKDAYSFDANEKGLNENYEKMYEAYHRIFSRCGLDFIAVKADSGIMGGSESAEFMVVTDAGEDIIAVCACGYASSLDPEQAKQQEGSYACPKCKNKNISLKRAIELGHVFKLGTKYTKALDALFLDKDGKEKPIIMGCYGIGINRIIATVIETHNDKDGIIWPMSIAPYKVIVMPLKINDEKVMQAAEKIYNELKKQGISCLLDDRDISAGVKFKDADLIGIPIQAVIGPNTIKEDKIEVKMRGKEDKEKIPLSAAIGYIKPLACG